MKTLAYKVAPFAVSALILAGAVYAAGWYLGPALVPSPGAILVALWDLACTGEVFRELSVTVARALVGIALANIAGVALGLAAGFIPGALRLVSPLVAALQSCPPVVWISLVMVWAGTGSPVPVATVFAATLPFVFSATAQGAMGLDRRIFAMSRLYEVPALRVIRRFVLPGIFPYWLASFSAVLTSGWKAAAVAEFLGSRDGVGAKIFWSYRKLNMEELNAWALALIILGVVLECGLIMPLRRKAAAMNTKGESLPQTADTPGNAALAPGLETNNPCGVEDEALPSGSGSHGRACTFKGQHPMLELYGISKLFGGRTVIASASLTLKEGEVLCLTGPSGIGKTTLLEITAGVTFPDKGNVARSAKASLMFQDDVLIPWLTAEEAVMYILPESMPENERRERATYWLHRFELNGGLYPATMSGGMRRRLSLARAFAAQTPLLLLDEPFAFLDPERCRAVAEEIARHAREGGIVMLTSHTTAPLHAGALADMPLRLLAVEQFPIVIG